MSTTTESTQLQCSFCAKANQQVKKLIAGPGVYICDECLALCNAIVVAEGGEVPKASVQQMVGLLRAAAEHAWYGGVDKWVRQCVDVGATWAQIAESLGITAADAESRFAGEKGELS